MSAEADDREMREQFQRLRREDEAQVPPFPELDAAALAGSLRPPVSPAPAGRTTAGTGGWRSQLAGLAPSGRRWTAALLVLALAGGAGLLRSWRPAAAPPPDESAVVRLSRWRPPTDSLLPGPADRLLREVPRLGQSSFDVDFTIGGHEER